MSSDEGARAGTGGWASEFSELATSLRSAGTIDTALGRIVEAGAALIPKADLVSLTLRRDDGRYVTAAANEQLAARLDQLQYELDEGPCVLASRRDGVGLFASSDLDGDPLLRRWGPKAARAGVHCALAVGLFAHEDPPRTGALNFFAFTRGALDDADRDAAVVLAAYAAAVLDSLTAAGAAREENRHLREALHNRDVIGQAKGVLMEREGINEDAAFELLRSVSQQTNVKLAELARTVAERRTEL
ncbi:GAF and ANTAR domain-containing protein [Pseudonocardia ailaonensis]|uniref:GAF and ANTAR domain-containing protein n=1 Tax=Pseudonocardia ailaonensis TaxID=367279 RepID=A0ABN2MJ33_9PSEU